MSSFTDTEIRAPRWPYVSVAAAFALLAMAWLLTTLSREAPRDVGQWGGLAILNAPLIIFTIFLSIRAWHPPVLRITSDGVELRVGGRWRHFGWDRMAGIDSIPTRNGSVIPVLLLQRKPGRAPKRRFLAYCEPISGAATFVTLRDAYDRWRAERPAST